MKRIHGIFFQKMVRIPLIWKGLWKKVEMLSHKSYTLIFIVCILSLSAEIGPGNTANQSLPSRGTKVG
jgi:hypothetical protein